MVAFAEATPPGSKASTRTSRPQAARRRYSPHRGSRQWTRARATRQRSPGSRVSNTAKPPTAGLGVGFDLVVTAVGIFGTVAAVVTLDEYDAPLRIPLERWPAGEAPCFAEFAPVPLEAAVAALMPPCPGAGLRSNWASCAPGWGGCTARPLGELRGEKLDEQGEGDVGVAPRSGLNAGPGRGGWSRPTTPPWMMPRSAMCVHRGRGSVLSRLRGAGSLFGPRDPVESAGAWLAPADSCHLHWIGAAETSLLV
jgi:hypothetical protein